MLSLLPLCSFRLGHSDNVTHLKPFYHHVIAQAEPSDICVAAANPSHYYVVGNKGSIGEIDENGVILRKTKNSLCDYEGVCMMGNTILAVDESARRIDFVNESDFKVTRSIFVHYGGPRNKGFEGITYVPSQKKFIMVTERPALLFELNDQLQVTAEVKMPQFYELSSVTYHDGFLYFLSDEAHEVMKCDLTDYHIIQRWKIPVTNPEGICFDKDNNLLIVSDDMATLFKFKMQ